MKTSIFYAAVLVVFACVLQVSACLWAYEVPVCATWTRADAAFLGKVIKIEKAEKSDDLPDGARKIRFQVSENFKGADNPTFTLYQPAWTTSCDPTFKKGDTWVVFAQNDIVVKSFKTLRAIKIKPKQPDANLEKLRSIVAGKTASAITGQLVSPTNDRAFLNNPIEIVVVNDTVRLTAQPDPSGAFNIAVPTEGVYKVEIKFPYRAVVKGNEFLLGASNTEGEHTVFRYEVRLNDGDCSFSLFEVLKKTQ